MLYKPRILSLFPNSFNKFNKTKALSKIHYLELLKLNLLLSNQLNKVAQRDKLRHCPLTMWLM